MYEIIEKLYRLWNQPSTKKGIIGLMGIFGVLISPEHWEAITFVVATAYSLFQVFHDQDKARVEGQKKLNEQGKGSLPVLIVLCLLTALACATIHDGLDTSEKRLNLALTQYNQAYDAYFAEVLKPELTPEQLIEARIIKPTPQKYLNDNLTEDQKKILKRKKEILTDVYPLLNLWRTYIEANEKVPEDLESNVNKLMGQIL